MKTLVILISGRGSNMEAIVEAALPARVAAVISNEPAARGLSYAAQRGIPTGVVNHRDYESRAAFDSALAQRIDQHGADFVILAGFMRILTPEFVNRYRGRLINIHPSLLPAYPGLHTHRRALQERAKLHGATVHFVTQELDGGPSILQAAVPVLDDDSEDALAARVLKQEHVIYPQALRWLVEGKVILTEQDKVEFRMTDKPRETIE